MNSKTLVPDGETSLDVGDARKLVSLLAECAIAGDINRQRVILMDRLSAFINADCWVWTTACKFEPGGLPIYAGFLKGGFTEERFARYLLACEHPDIAFLNEALTREFSAQRRHITRLREQIDVENRFSSSRAYPLWCAAGIDKVIMSMRPGDDGAVTAIGFYRTPSQPAFYSRESRIAHIVLSEVPWLFFSTVPETTRPVVVTLSPRERVTLDLLLEGHNRSQIASLLGLSPHTVDGYVKKVFRSFRAHSQSALIARFENGDGGDIP